MKGRKDNVPITDEQLAKWWAKTDAATEGPWCVDECYADGGPPMGVYAQHAADKFLNVFRAVERSMTLPNAEFIATAREAMPALLREVARLEKLVCPHRQSQCVDCGGNS